MARRSAALAADLGVRHLLVAEAMLTRTVLLVLACALLASCRDARATQPVKTPSES